MSQVVNIKKCFDLFKDTFSPKVVGELNNQIVLVVRCEGDKVPWHVHKCEDEMFLVIEGVLEVQENSGSKILNSGEFYIVGKGIKHRVVPRGHVKLMLFEPKGIEHTGGVYSEITRKSFDKLVLVDDT